MRRRIGALVGLSAVALLAAGSLSFAAEAVKQDSEVAAEYKSEAAQLQDKAEHHRKLAANYKSRTPPKGSGSYASVAQDRLQDLCSVSEVRPRRVDRSVTTGAAARQPAAVPDPGADRTAGFDRENLTFLKGVSEAIAGIDEVLDRRAPHCRAPALEWFGGSRPPPTRATM